MDKWDYLQGPIIEKYLISCFDIGEVPRSPGKLNWNQLNFLPFSFIFIQCEHCVRGFSLSCPEDYDSKNWGI